MPTLADYAQQSLGKMSRRSSKAGHATSRREKKRQDLISLLNGGKMFKTNEDKPDVDDEVDHLVTMPI